MSEPIIIRRLANVARPGVIVSTIVESDGRSETVTFTRDPSETVGFTTKVERGNSADALVAHALAVAVAR
jgi:hypothetical protein